MKDAQYQLYVLKKVRRGQADVRTGKWFSNEEAKERLRKWIDS